MGDRQNCQGYQENTRWGWTYKDEKGRIVNHTEAIGWDGSAAVNNDETYLFTKFARALGITYLEHCARLCHSSTVAALSASFGRGR